MQSCKVVVCFRIVGVCHVVKLKLPKLVTHDRSCIGCMWLFYWQMLVNQDIFKIMIPKKNCYFLCRNVIATLLFCTFLFLLIRHYFSYSSSESSKSHPEHLFFEEKNLTPASDILHKDSSAQHANNAILLSYETHVFYYPWYGNPEDDSVYLHWK